MRWISSLLLFAAAPAAAQVNPIIPIPAPAQVPIISVFNPAADYISVGQDEQGYRSWYGASLRHAAGVKGFNDYLTQWGVSGILPTWQILRTATSWQRCGGAPFEIPPVSEWPHIVQTLRYINDFVIPTVGPVEAVSVYRNPVLNVCAGGAPESAHKHYSAIDMVPLRPINREELMRKLCAVHARRGTDYSVGLGFYAFLRFHVDTTKYRRWGADPNLASCPPIIRPNDIANSGQPLAPPVAVATDPLAPIVQSAPATVGPKVVFAPPTPEPAATTLPQPQQR
jgi:Peptidase M15